MRAIEEVEVIDITSAGASEVFGRSRGRKRKAVNSEAGTGHNEPASGPRKLRKRA